MICQARVAKYIHLPRVGGTVQWKAPPVVDRLQEIFPHPPRRLNTRTWANNNNHPLNTTLDPALLDPYVESQTQGISDLTEMVTTYQSCCPDSKMVLLGYSQGAHVTADFLCGRSEAGFSPTPAYASQVAEDREFFLSSLSLSLNGRCDTLSKSVRL